MINQSAVADNKNDNYHFSNPYSVRGTILDILLLFLTYASATTNTERVFPSLLLLSFPLPVSKCVCVCVWLKGFKEMLVVV